MSPLQLLHRSILNLRRNIMFSPLMTLMDRVTMALVVVLAAVPTLAVAVNTVIA